MPDTTQDIKNIGFIPFGRVDAEKRTVEGVITSEAVDTFETRFDYEATKKTIFSKNGFNFWRNLRAMHQPVAAGVVDEIRCDDSEKAVSVVARVVDDAEWNKVKNGVYKGFSIGGIARASVVEDVDGRKVTRFTEYDLVEVSLVDRPSNPDARINVFRIDIDDLAFKAKWDAMGAHQALTMVADLVTQKLGNGSTEDAQALKPALDALNLFISEKIGAISTAIEAQAQADKVVEMAANMLEGENETKEGEAMTNQSRAADGAQTSPAQAVEERKAEAKPEAKTETQAEANVTRSDPKVDPLPELTPEMVARAVIDNPKFVQMIAAEAKRAYTDSLEAMVKRVDGIETGVGVLTKDMGTLRRYAAAGPILRDVTGDANEQTSVQGQIKALDEAIKGITDPFARQALEQRRAALGIQNVYATGGNRVG